MIAVWLSSAAEHRGETGDAPRIHQRGIGRRKLFGEDHRTFRQILDRGVGRLGEIAHQARADDADIVDARRQISVAHLGKTLGDLGDLVHDGALSIDALGLDATLDAAHEARIREHVQDARRADSRPLPWPSLASPRP